MLLLPIFLAAKALAASTYTVTVLDDNPDARTLSTPASTADGDVVTYLTLYPDGVNTDGQTRYVQQTGVSAEQTVTSLLNIPPTTTPTASPAGTVTQDLPWYQGHHIEVLTVTDPDGTVHEVTRIDQQSTHVTVHASTKANGDVVLVSSGSYPPETTTDASTATTTDVLTDVVTDAPTDTASDVPAGTTTVTDVAPLPTHEKLMGFVRKLPFCNNGSITWTTIEPACWPVYDSIVPTQPPVNMTPAECTGDKHRTATFTVAHIPMRGSAPTDTAAAEAKEFKDSMRESKNAIKDLFRSHYDGCEAVQNFVDFGTCGGVHLVSQVGPETLRIKAKKSRKSWLRKWWWIIPLILLGLGLFLLPCLLCMRRRKRRNAEKPLKQEAVTVVQQPVPVVVASGAGGAGGASGAAGSTSSGAGGSAVPVGAAGSGGAGGTGTTTTGTTAPATTVTPAGAAPATTTTTGAPTEVVTTTTETNKDHAGTMRRAAEEGRAGPGPRVRFDGQPADHNPTAAHQVDGTAEFRTGSEVFDVGSMRGRKRNRGDEPL
jgi:hypothetical protein